MNTEETEASKQKLVEAQAGDKALPQLVEVNQANLLVLPRIACDAPSIERLLARPAALAGIFLGLGIFFGFLYSLVINPAELDFIDPIWLSFFLLVILIIIGKSTTRLADRFNCPALPDFVAGALYPYGKVLSMVGLPIVEVYVWDQLADAAKQSGRFDDAAACIAKLLSFEKPMDTQYKIAENDYCWNLIFDGQIDRAKLYADHRLNYCRRLIGDSQYPKENALFDLAFTAHYAASVYEAAGDENKANAIREEAFEKIKSGNGRRLSYNLGCLIKADQNFSQGDFASAAAMYETHLDNQKLHPMESNAYNSLIKGRALLRLALCKAHQNDEEEAIRTLARAQKDIFKELSLGRRLEFDRTKEAIEKILAGEAPGNSHLIPLDTEAIRQPRGEAACSHEKEECSFIPGPVKILTQSSIWLLAMVAGSVPVFFSTLKHPDPKNITFTGIALAITLILVARKNKKITETTRIVKGEEGFPVTVKFNKHNVNLTDLETGEDLGFFNMNEHLYVVLNSRIEESFEAIAYRDEKEIKALSAFGYASDLSRAKPTS